MVLSFTKQHYIFMNFIFKAFQFAIFNSLGYCFVEIIGFDAKASFASRPVSRLISWSNEPGDITKEFWEKAIHFKLIWCVDSNVDRFTSSKFSS